MKLSQNSHRRKNILTGEWVLVSPNRTKRPWQGKKEVKNKIDSNKELLIMCKAGGRSMMAAQLLSQENIKCINISDGFEGNSESSGWKNENLPSKVVDLNT